MGSEPLLLDNIRSPPGTTVDELEPKTICSAVFDTELGPIATELERFALELNPIAIACVPVAEELLPIETELLPPAIDEGP